MRISKLTASQAAIVAANSRMSRYLERLLIGKPATKRSWLYEDEDANSVLDRWMQILKHLENGSYNEKLIFKFDTKQLSKFGPQGAVPPLKEAISLESFQEQYHINHSNIKFDRDLSDILNVRKHCIQYRSLDRVYDVMQSKGSVNTNSGWPLYTTRNLVKRESIMEARSGEAWKYPAIILFRSYNGKLRVVWMYPMSMNLIEYTATQPLQELITNSTQYVTPWLGFTPVKQRFTELWAKHPYAFGGDTTAMDAHMQIDQNNAVASAFSSLFLNPTVAVESLLHVNDIDLIVGPNAKISNQSHGVASGSGWTQLCETIFQIETFDSYIRNANLDLTINDGMGIGDDYVWFFDTKPDSANIVRYWQELGLPGKEEKQSNEDNSCTFLQRLFIKHYMSRDDSQTLGGIYPTIRALNSLLNPERWYQPKDWNSDMFCVRCYMILENTVDHPLFEEFVKFVVKGQKDLLPFAKQTAANIDAAQFRSRLIPGLNPSYNQEKQEKPLSEFTSIRFASTL